MSQIHSSNIGNIRKIIPDTGDDVIPNIAGEVNLAGGNLVEVTGTAATETLTIDVVGGTNGQVIIASTAGVPTFATISSAGGTIAFTPGANTLNMEAGAGVPTSFLTDDANSAVPALNVLTIAGGTNIATSSAGSTVTIALDGTTNHAVQIGNVTNSLTSLAVGNTAQVLKGNTGADPSWGAVDLTTDVSGILPVGSGGTGVGTITAHALPIGDGVNAINELAVGATNQVLLGNTGADPSWGTVGNAALTNSSVTLNNGNNITVTGSPISLGGAASFNLTGTTQFAVQVGDATGSLDSLAVGATGTLLVGATGANPAFATSADGNFAFTNATAATPRVLSVENNDTDAGSYACVSVSTEPAGGDAYVFFEIDSATQYYSCGIDNSDSDKWKLTNNVDPSSGDAIISTTSTGVITLHNDLDVTEGGTGVSTLTSHGILLGNGTGDIQATAEPSDGQIIIGKTGDFPQLASLTAGVGISITPGAGSISIAATAAGFAWSAVTVDAALVVNTGTIANKAGLLTMTLPATAALGDVIKLTGINTAVGWRIAQNANQRIHLAGSSTTAGITGYIEATQIRDSVELVCVVAGASTEYNVISSIGNITVA